MDDSRYPSVQKCTCYHRLHTEWEAIIWSPMRVFLAIGQADAGNRAEVKFVITFGSEN
jgi:hypothetical protein